MGRPPPGVERDAALRRALIAAQADEFVARLPQGLETPLAERGANLSGGEAQRLALARAFCARGRWCCSTSRPRISMPTRRRSSCKACRTCAKGRTALTIAHRLETVACADRIVVIDHGRVVEHGTPQRSAGRGQPLGHGAAGRIAAAAGGAIRCMI